jgi:hypothetical protein
VEKYRIAGQATDDNIIWCMRFECWLTNATDTHSLYIYIYIKYLLLFDGNNGYVNATQYYVIRTLRVLLHTRLEMHNARLIIRGFYVGENSYSGVLCRWLVGYQRFGKVRCLYLVAGSGGVATSKRSQSCTRLHGVMS